MVKDVITEIELVYKPNMEAFFSSEGKTGQLIGNWIGTAKGKITGKVMLHLSENEGRNLCDASIEGIIETVDDAKINFHVMGLFLKPKEGTILKLVTGVTFNTEKKKYKWLDNKTAVWQGNFDMSSHQHKYKISLVGNSQYQPRTQKKV